MGKVAGRRHLRIKLLLGRVVHEKSSDGGGQVKVLLFQSHDLKLKMDEVEKVTTRWRLKPANT